MTAPREDTRPIIDLADRAVQEELSEWTYDVPEEFRRAMVRAMVYALRDAAMLNFDRPWETSDDQTTTDDRPKETPGGSA